MTNIAIMFFIIVALLILIWYVYQIESTGRKIQDALDEEQKYYRLSDFEEEML